MSPGKVIWYAANPPTLRSYVLAWCIQQLRLSAAKGRRNDILYRQEDKRQVNRAVIEALVGEAREGDLRLLFVTFPNQVVSSTSWRDEFLEELFVELDVPCVDGRSVLRAAAKSEGKHYKVFFRSDGHPNIRGNELLGEAIAARLSELRGK
ncbi:MAG: SGNH/GDSL hydrolase family protein [bacterium]|nr:SGNH/GDSL hydrolase family protein [bacterium]